MKKVLFLILLASVVHLTQIPAFGDGQPSISLFATVEQASGDVRAAAGNSDTFQPLKAGMSISAGTVIKTGPGARCVIKWGRDNAVIAGGDTEMSLSRLSKTPETSANHTEIIVKAGTLAVHSAQDAKQNSSFTLKLPGADAEIIGADIAASVAQDGWTAFNCSRGKAIVTGAASANAGIETAQSTLISPDGVISAPSAMTAAEAKTISGSYSLAAPYLAIMEPNGDKTTDMPGIAVRGRTTPGADVNVNGMPVLPDATGAFSTIIDLEPGPNHITITAVSPLGASVEKSRNITFRAGAPATHKTYVTDDSPPTLVILKPGSVFLPGENGCSDTGSLISCVITGFTTEGSSVEINGERVPVESDGTFSHTVTVAFDSPDILVNAVGANGKRVRTSIRRGIDPQRIHTITVTATPQSIVANGTETASVTIRAYNYLHQPVDTEITLTVEGSGSVTPSAVTTAGGSATAIYRSTIGTDFETVRVVATSENRSASASIDLIPDVPPIPTR